MPADVAKDPELSPGSHTPPSELPPLLDEAAPEGENHAPDTDSQGKLEEASKWESDNSQLSVDINVCIF